MCNKGKAFTLYIFTKTWFPCQSLFLCTRSHPHFSTEDMLSPTSVSPTRITAVASCLPQIHSVLSVWHSDQNLQSLCSAQSKSQSPPVAFKSCVILSWCYLASPPGSHPLTLCCRHAGSLLFQEDPRHTPATVPLDPGTLFYRYPQGPLSTSCKSSLQCSLLNKFPYLTWPPTHPLGHCDLPSC